MQRAVVVTENAESALIQIGNDLRHLDAVIVDVTRDHVPRPDFSDVRVLRNANYHGPVLVLVTILNEAVRRETAKYQVRIVTNDRQVLLSHLREIRVLRVRTM
jgi:hypothetical protein